MRLQGILLLVFICCLTFLKVEAQGFYWVGFTDKNNTSFSLDDPGKYLSERAIQRRERQQIAIDSLDLPVNGNYVKSITELGVELVNTSKWLNGITVKSTIDSFQYKVLQLSFVKEVQLTKKIGTKSANNKWSTELETGSDPIDSSYYGLSVSQVSTLNGQFLHNHGYRGQGMHIAILDGGFFNANIYPAFDSLRANRQILGTKDFVDPQSNIYTTHYHGMSVLSCMGGNIPGQLIGTAPEASYWLIRSEDTGSEFLIEEDNWVAAAEFADSVGCDVINSSLGYSTFDDPTMNHTYAEMDGKTTRATRGANIAATRGILVFVSAGNEGNKSWKYISAPSDGENVLGVGAMNKDTIAASFSSFGPAFGGQTKPNVSAIGWNTYMQLSNGTLGYASGTSFSSPVMAGMAACYWQSVRHVPAAEIKKTIEKFSHLYSNPHSQLGFGVPDFEKAWHYYFPLGIADLEESVDWFVYPNPVADDLVLQKKSKNSGKTDVAIFSTDGKVLLQKTFSDGNRFVIEGTNQLPVGILILKISSEGKTESFKLSKIQ
jgi:hypothetical protein